MTRRAVAVQIAGQEYRIRSEVDESSLQRVASCVDAAMSQIRERTGTVDSLDVAILTSLNLAREVLALRERISSSADETLDGDRLRGLIELAESALMPGRDGGEETPLLTLPTGDEVDEAAPDLLGALIEGTPIEPETAPH